MICGIVASGACAAVQIGWRAETFEMLRRYACSSHVRVRRGVATAYQHLLAAVPDQTSEQLMYCQRRELLATMCCHHDDC